MANIESVLHPLVLVMQNHMELAKYLPFFKYHYYNIDQARENLFAFFKNQIEEHSKRVDHYSEPTDYVEAFLQEKKKKEAEGEGEFYRLEI